MPQQITREAGPAGPVVEDQARARQHARWRRDGAQRCPGVLTGRFHPRHERDDAGDRDPEIARAVIQAKRGDNEAMRYLYLRYADSVYGYVLSIVHDEHEAEDVTQQVFAKLFTVIERYEPRQVPFAAWIVRVARNVAVDHLRAQRQIPCEEVFGPDDSVDASRHDRVLALRAALATLPEEQRNVVVLRHLYGYSPGEIGDLMGKTQPSVHGLHHRARQALRTELERLQSAPATAA